MNPQRAGPFGQATMLLLAAPVLMHFIGLPLFRGSYFDWLRVTFWTLYAGGIFGLLRQGVLQLALRRRVRDLNDV